MELNKYKTNIYTDFTIFSFHRPTTLSKAPPPLRPDQPSQNRTIPSPRTATLASLVKGEVLSPEKIRATTGGIATPPSLTLRTNPKHYTKTGHKGAERQGI